MKKTIEKEKGYALLVVLFLIVFIFTVSAVFIRGSLSNAKQEQRVDQNHLSVVAAEMGVDYYIGKINNEERKIQKNALELIRDDVDTFNACGGKSNPKKPGCKSVLSIEAIKNKVKTQYLGGINDLVNDIKKSETTNIKMYSSETVKIDSSSYSYEVDKPEVYLVEKDEELIVRMGIIGKSKAERPKLLTTVLSYDLPKFVIRKSTSGNHEKLYITPTSIYNLFENNQDYKHKVACTENGHCSSGKFYSEGDVTAKNPNNQGGLQWVHSGYLYIKNMNQFNFNLIVNSLEVGNMNQMKGKLVLLGTENKKGKIIPEKNFSIKFQSSGKLCINVDGFSKSDIEKITFDKPDHVYFYSSLENPTWPKNANESHKVSGSLVDFVNNCIGQPIIEVGSDSSDDVHYEVFESTLDLSVDVKY